MMFPIACNAMANGTLTLIVMQTMNAFSLDSIFTVNAVAINFGLMSLILTPFTIVILSSIKNTRAVLSIAAIVQLAGSAIRIMSINSKAEPDFVFV